MGRKIFLIDGFNLYHSLSGNPSFKKYKWVNLRKLCECFQFSDTIEGIYYFTALATWNPDKVFRHQQLIDIYSDLGIETNYGAFRKKNRKCKLCNREINTFEEKQTDVNIAIKLFELAYLDKFDTAIIISGDSDLIPAINKVKSIFINKKIGVLIPIGRKAEELKQVCDFNQRIKQHHLNQSILNDPYTLRNGINIHCPANWK